MANVILPVDIQSGEAACLRAEGVTTLFSVKAGLRAALLVVVLGGAATACTSGGSTAPSTTSSWKTVGLGSLGIKVPKTFAVMSSWQAVCPWYGNTIVVGPQPTLAELAPSITRFDAHKGHCPQRLRGTMVRFDVLEHPVGVGASTGEAAQIVGYRVGTPRPGGRARPRTDVVTSTYEDAGHALSTMLVRIPSTNVDIQIWAPGSDQTAALRLGREIVATVNLA